MKKINLDDPILGFKRPDADKCTIYGEIIPMDYSEVLELDVKLRDICEQRAKEELQKQRIVI